MAELASRRHCVDRIRTEWPGFQHRRTDRLAQRMTGGHVAERVAENICEDLFTVVLDWPRAGIKYQVDDADLLLTSHGIKYVVIEAKRPGSLVVSARAVARAFDQGLRYAHRQKVRCVAVSDGDLLDVRDVTDGGLKPRIRVHLAATSPPEELWWVSTLGIFRIHTLVPEPDEAAPETAFGSADGAEQLLHRRYKLPARCFAYVGDATRPATWKLPYLYADGDVDERRLPKAIQAVLRDYRGARVTLPEAAVPDVLLRLGNAACRLGRMPHQTTDTAEVYLALELALDQLDRLSELSGAEAAVSALV